MFSRVKKLSPVIALLALTTLMGPLSARGQAYCSLRDPNRIVQELFPQATGFRSYLRRVTREKAAALKSELPVEFDAREFTTHTLYAVHQKGEILGYVQSRTEEVEWGLAEIIWILDPELHLVTFRFQRCRSQWKTPVESDALQIHLQGLSEADLVRLWQNQGTGWLLERAKLPKAATKIVDAVVMSGLKAMGLARVVWGEDIASIQNVLRESQSN